MSRQLSINSWSLRRRTVLVCGAIVIGVWLAMLLSVCWHLTAHKKAEVQQYGMVLIDDISKWTRDYLQAYDYFTLRAQLQHYRHVENLHNAAIYDDTGRLVAFYPAGNSELYETIEKFIDPSEFGVHEGIAEEQDHFEQLLRLESVVRDGGAGRNLGFVRIYLSETRALQTVRQILWPIVGYGVLLGGILILCLDTFLSRLLVPLATLARECPTVDVSTGAVTVPGSEKIPELRILMSAFNTMMQRLQQQQCQLIKQEKTLVMVTVAQQVAHDIRSPLAALRALVGQVDGVPEEHRLMMRNAVQRIGDIANDLQAQRTEQPGESPSGGDPPSVQLLSSVLDPLISEKRAHHRARLGVEIHAELDTGSYGVFAAVPPAEFKRVVSNLINNGVEAMDRGLVTVAILHTAAQVVLTVTDTGQGIPPDVVPRLMQHGATFGKAGGSGLGLYHARTAVERWGGTLALASTVGVGTTVTITLPRADAPAWFVPALELTPGGTLVIVDDDVTIHQIWQDRVEGLGLPPPGITLHHFSSGEEVTQWYHGQTDALFLCDYEFLGTPNNGLELIAQLGVADRAILVTSHYEEASVQARCAALGVRLIPKGLAGFVPLRGGAAASTATAVVMTSATPVLAPTEASAHLTALVIEDDAALRGVWPMEARRLGLAAVTTFASLEDCEAAHPDYAAFDFAFVDKNIPESAYRIDQVIERLKARGVKRVFVASGESARALTSDPLCAAADGIIPMKIPQKLPR